MGGLYCARPWQSAELIQASFLTLGPFSSRPFPSFPSFLVLSFSPFPSPSLWPAPKGSQALQAVQGEMHGPGILFHRGKGSLSTLQKVSAVLYRGSGGGGGRERGMHHLGAAPGTRPHPRTTTGCSVPPSLPPRRAVPLGGHPPWAPPAPFQVSLLPLPLPAQVTSASLRPWEGLWGSTAFPCPRPLQQPRSAFCCLIYRPFIEPLVAVGSPHPLRRDFSAVAANSAPLSADLRDVGGGLCPAGTPRAPLCPPRALKPGKGRPPLRTPAPPRPPSSPRLPPCAPVNYFRRGWQKAA